MAFDDGSKLVQITGGPLLYYLNYTVTTLYYELSFGGNVNTIILANDSATDVVSISFDGSTLFGELQGGDSVTLHTKSRSSVWLRGVAGGDKTRVWGY